jgi:hypothetical protein
LRRGRVIRRGRTELPRAAAVLFLHSFRRSAGPISASQVGLKK